MSEGVSIILNDERYRKLEAHAKHMGDESAPAALFRMIDELPPDYVSNFRAFVGAPRDGFSDI